MTTTTPAQCCILCMWRPARWRQSFACYWLPCTCWLLVPRGAGTRAPMPDIMPLVCWRQARALAAAPSACRDSTAVACYGNGASRQQRRRCEAESDGAWCVVDELQHVLVVDTQHRLPVHTNHPIAYANTTRALHIA